MHLVFWIGNGFDPRVPNQPDAFSRASLQQAVQRYSHYKIIKQTVLFPIIQSLVRGPTGLVWHQVMTAAASAQGVATSDMPLTRPTLNALTDAEAMIEFAQEYPDSEIHIFVYAGGAVALYLGETYRAVARHFYGQEFDFELYSPAISVPDLKSQILYFCLWGVTQLISWNSWLFLKWYNFRDSTDRKRLERFRRTVS